MKKIQYSLIVMLIALFSACDDRALPTFDTVDYDPTQKPTIESNVELDNQVRATGETFVLDIEFHAYNSLSEIIVNNELTYEFAPGQLIHRGVELTMPNQFEYPVKIIVIDELDLKDSIEFTIKKKTLPIYYFAKFTTSGENLADKTNPDRPIFPAANAASAVYSDNCGWYKTEVLTGFQSELELEPFLYGAIGGNSTANAPKWAEAIEFTGEAEKFDSTMLVQHVTTEGAFNAFFINKIVFENALAADLVSDIAGVDAVEGKTPKTITRQVMMDIYVDTQTTSDGKASTFDINKHSLVTIGMANVAKYSNTSNNNFKPSGQDYPMSANITETDKWTTLVFTVSDDDILSHARKTGDILPSEVDMFVLSIAAQMGKTGDVTNAPSNARYFVRNIRTEERR